ncbi:uncharacterized protein [Elaeis guineensis]|uniref:uncharacterized protein isoform X2 n=1 Tax=Elaeis guineensis var. tenera TaxID=51953 RepID=UPI003C6CD706
MLISAIVVPWKVSVRSMFQQISVKTSDGQQLHPLNSAARSQTLCSEFCRAGGMISNVSIMSLNVNILKSVLYPKMSIVFWFSVLVCMHKHNAIGELA